MCYVFLNNKFDLVSIFILEHEKSNNSLKWMNGVKMNWLKEFSKYKKAVIQRFWFDLDIVPWYFHFLRIMCKLKGWRINKQRILFILKHDHIKI